MTTSSFKDHFSAHAAQYAQYRPHYPPELFTYLASQVERRELAWDAGTGNGQAALGLAEHFRAVVATDPSSEQIANATRGANVSYLVAAASVPTLTDHSVDLVTVAQAYHWFDHAAFLAEVDRVTRPGALVALWCYVLPRVNDAVDKVVDHFYDDVTAPYWEPERAHVEVGYQDLPFPFDLVDAPPFAMTASYDLNTFAGYLNTWSATRKATRLLGENPLVGLMPELTRAWGGESEKKTVRWPVLTRIGRVAK